MTTVQHENLETSLSPMEKKSTVWYRIKAQSAREWSVFVVAWPWLLLGVVWQLFHNWAHNWVYYLSGKYGVYGGPQEALVDFGHKLFPEINTLTVSIIPENPVLYTVMLIAILYIIIIPVFRRRTDFTAVGALWRTLMVSIFAVTFRVISFMVTLLPAPAPHCQQFAPSSSPDEPTFAPPLDASGILLGFDVQFGCGDLVFSSHQMYGLLAALLITHYSRNIWLKIIVWLLNIALSCLIMAQRSHYTLDVVVAWYTVPMVWLCWFHFFPNDPVKHMAFWKDQPARSSAAATVATGPETQGVDDTEAGSNEMV